MSGVGEELEDGEDMIMITGDESSSNLGRGSANSGFKTSCTKFWSASASSFADEDADEMVENRRCRRARTSFSRWEHCVAAISLKWSCRRWTSWSCDPCGETQKRPYLGGRVWRENWEGSREKPL